VKRGAIKQERWHRKIYSELSVINLVDRFFSQKKEKEINEKVIERKTE
jgi:hypothetical protein